MLLRIVIFVNYMIIYILSYYKYTSQFKYNDKLLDK